MRPTHQPQHNEGLLSADILSAQESMNITQNLTEIENKKTFIQIADTAQCVFNSLWENINYLCATHKRSVDDRLSNAFIAKHSKYTSQNRTKISSEK